MTLSKQQNQFLEIATVGNNVQASASPGAGKSHTLSATAHALVAANPKLNGVAITFSSSLAEELRGKLPDKVPSRTVHSIGLQVLQTYFGKQRLKKDDRKYPNILTERRIFGQKRKDFQKIIGNIQKMNMTVQDIYNYCYRKYNPDMAKELVEIFEDGVNLFIIKGIVSFSDMVHFPIFLGLQESAQHYTHILLDEVHDLSPLYLDLIKMHSDTGTQFITCGEPQQAIHNWMGISLRRFEEIQGLLDANCVRFNETYRLPEAVTQNLHDLNLTNDVVTNKKMLGSVNEISYEDMLATIPPGSMILSRFRAGDGHSLSKTGLALRKLGKKVRYKSASPTSVVKYFCVYANKNGRGRPLMSVVNDWEDKQYRDLASTIVVEDIDEEKMLIAESVDIVRSHLEEYGGSECAGFQRYVDNLYKGDSSDAIFIGTCHGSKGLQSENVYILNPHQFMSKVNTLDSYISECNLLYVAFSRSMETLNFVDGENVTPVEDKYLEYYSR